MKLNVKDELKGDTLKVWGSIANSYRLELAKEIKSVEVIELGIEPNGWRSCKFSLH